MRREDNLQVEGQMEGRQVEAWRRGERAEMVRQQDNLAVEGEFQTKQVEQWRAGERAQVNPKHCNRVLYNFTVTKIIIAKRQM